MQTTTPSNDIADYYVYDQEGVLQRRTPDRAEVDTLLAVKFGWYARIVVFSDDPIICATKCPHCSQPYVS